jgi:hypothetical protein
MVLSDLANGLVEQRRIFDGYVTQLREATLAAEEAGASEAAGLRKAYGAAEEIRLHRFGAIEEGLVSALRVAK